MAELTTTADADRLILRSRPALLMGSVLSLLLMGGAVLLWVQMGPLARSQWTLPQLVTIIIFILVMVGVMMSIGLSQITCTPNGVTIRNAIRTHSYPWSEIDTFTMGSGDPWPYLLLRPVAGAEEGEAKMILAVQRAEGEAGEGHVQQLRAYAAAHRV